MSDNRYLKCETITGEWWYKDLKTGEDLPLYATPIRGLEEDDETNYYEDLDDLIKADLIEKVEE